MNWSREVGPSLLRTLALAARDRLLEEVPVPFGTGSFSCTPSMGIRLEVKVL
jgi:hypothetical protein